MWNELLWIVERNMQRTLWLLLSIVLGVVDLLVLPVFFVLVWWERYAFGSAVVTHTPPVTRPTR